MNPHPEDDAGHLLSVNPSVVIRLGVIFLLLCLSAGWGWQMMIRMPGESYDGPLPPLSEKEERLREALRLDVEKLANEIGERHLFRRKGLEAAANFIESSLKDAGHEVNRQEFLVEGEPCANIEVEIRGTVRSQEIVIVGAHYDTVAGSPGANDNATGVAGLLALARAFVGKKPSRTLRLVAFVNEEPPHFQSESMGSFVYAKRCRERSENVVAMLSLETIGYFTDEPGSQSYPFPLSLFYPSSGDFIGFVGNYASRSLVRECVGSFRRHARFPSEGGAFPAFLPGIGWSDHWAFWQHGYRAVMITDTAPFRYPHYHMPDDTPEKVCFDRLARVVGGLEHVVWDLAECAISSGKREDSHE